MQKLALLYKTSRPISWVNTAYPFAAGYVLMSGRFDTTLIVGILFFLIPYNLLMYGINDVFDYESDIRNPRKGGVEGAITPQKYHGLIVWSSIVLSAPFVLYLSMQGNWASIATLAALLFFVVAYSAKGLRFKEVPVLDSITSSIHFVGPLVYAYTLTSSSAAAWTIAAAFFAWGMASHAFGAVQDIIPDREARLGSIATVFGAAWTMRLAIALYLFAAVACMSLGGSAVVIGIAGLAYVFNIMPFWSITDQSSPRTNTGWKRFLLINYLVGAVITICLILTHI